MKKLFLLIVIILSCAPNFFAQDYSVIQKFVFHEALVLNRDFSIQERIPSESGDPMGLYIFTEIEDKKCILVTIGEEPKYEILIVNIVEGDVEDGRRIDMYQGGMHFKGEIVVINVFLEFDISKNSKVPESITIDVNNSPNFIQFKGILPLS